MKSQGGLALASQLRMREELGAGFLMTYLVFIRGLQIFLLGLSRLAEPTPLLWKTQPEVNHTCVVLPDIFVRFAVLWAENHPLDHTHL